MHVTVRPDPRRECASARTWVDLPAQIDDATERLLQAVYSVRSATGTLPVITPGTEA